MEEPSTVRIMANAKWVRGFVAGRLVVDSRQVRFVWENPFYPAWYIPVEDVAAELVEDGTTVTSPSRGTATRYALIVDGVRIDDAASRYLDSAIEELRGLVRLDWNALDSWFEEEVEVFVHPRSPEVRVDALESSRHVRVTVDGTVVADSDRPTVLFETGLPPRYYVPKSAVRMDLLEASSSQTACPYKGWASYWNVVVDGRRHDDLAWSYRTPLPEAASVAGLVCFYNEHIDIEVDGRVIERPTTVFTENPFA